MINPELAQDRSDEQYVADIMHGYREAVDQLDRLSTLIAYDARFTQRSADLLAEQLPADAASALMLEAKVVAAQLTVSLERKGALA